MEYLASMALLQMQFLTLSHVNQKSLSLTSKPTRLNLESPLSSIRMSTFSTLKSAVQKAKVCLEMCLQRHFYINCLIMDL